MHPFEHWLRQVGIACNQLLSALTGGWADETVSARAYRLEKTGHRAGRILRPVIDAMFRYLPDGILGGRNHCFRAMLLERERKQLPPELR